LAWWAGALIEDIEFIQFHPTILNTGESPFFLISETVRGEGGILRNSEGSAFMDNRHPLKDLAPRDKVSQEMVQEQKTGPVYLDITHQTEDFLEKRFPTIFGKCLENGYNMAHDLIPVSPAAHYQCGGIKVNLYGETSITGLYAFGECACTGVHGSNRMASNSLLECISFTSIAVENMKANKVPKNKYSNRPVEVLKIPGVWKLKSWLQDLMWSDVGINRSLIGLENALSELNMIHEQIENMTGQGMDPALMELHNLETVARLVIRAAMTRSESRGTHHLTDYPEMDKAWTKHIVFHRNRITIV
jgi:L-aspartate oxidase